MNKAYIIKTKIDIDNSSWGIYSGKTAPKVKTYVMSSLKDIYRESNYSWITSCRRIPEYDNLAQKYDGCIAWKQGTEHWEQDKGHWYGM